ncbi:hypothetical protein L228DRAFT_32945 [Xylona heveae TC161]|uniref:Uncharacterized protein n=1 Tax=Xylona heveae (strain CBS 132557 / TC161) TaxID=1328760 RepID=A0A165A5J7_XYLHT|nr:hypothetical protein L228DRAFT_32945 [Xylona heveae TC161]KZF19982.1 hypothetical protein L228DRAFT_32945 [Xylona heveae TC161]
MFVERLILNSFNGSFSMQPFFVSLLSLSIGKGLIKVKCPQRQMGQRKTFYLIMIFLFQVGIKDFAAFPCSSRNKKTKTAASRQMMILIRGKRKEKAP